MLATPRRLLSSLRRHAVPETLPELRACFQEQRPVRVSDITPRWPGMYQQLFASIGAEALEALEGEDQTARGVIGARWLELHDAAVNTLAVDDSLVLGLRADLRYEDDNGTFQHRYIAWSKAQQRTLAQGGATITCMRDGEATRVPKSWVYRLEVDHGDHWASMKIIEFRRGMGLRTDGSHAHQLDGIDEDLDPPRLQK